MTHQPEKKKTFLSILEELNQQEGSLEEQNGFPITSLESSEEEAFGEFSSLTDELDHEILMHRDAHFGGDFNVMAAYYQNDSGLGINPDFDLDRILYLTEVETQLGKNLASLVLTGAEAEQVANARLAYKRLKQIYETSGEKSPFPRLIADLILSEDEEPAAEVGAVVAQGTRIVPELISLLSSDEFYNPLFPGYGYAPYLALICLGEIGDSSAIIPIFETLSKECLFDELVVLEALAQIGEPAKAFLLQRVKGRPLTQDNTNAAFALTVFADDPQVASACFEEIKTKEVREKPLLRSYLLCCCVEIKETPYYEEFIKASEDQDFPLELRTEIKSIISDWKD